MVCSPSVWDQQLRFLKRWLMLWSDALDLSLPRWLHHSRCTWFTRMSGGSTNIETVVRRIEYPLSRRQTRWPHLGNNDAIRHELRLPEGKLQRLMDQWLGRRSCTRKELEGILQHACKVINTGRSFLRWLIALLSIAKSRYHHIHLNKEEFKSSLAWWKGFCHPLEWNIIDYQPGESTTGLDDASGSWGCGA